MRDFLHGLRFAREARAALHPRLHPSAPFGGGENGEWRAGTQNQRHAAATRPSKIYSVAGDGQQAMPSHTSRPSGVRAPALECSSPPVTKPGVASTVFLFAAPSLIALINASAIRPHHIALGLAWVVISVWAVRRRYVGRIDLAPGLRLTRRKTERQIDWSDLESMVPTRWRRDWASVRVRLRSRRVIELWLPKSHLLPAMLAMPLAEGESQHISPTATSLLRRSGPFYLIATLYVVGVSGWLVYSLLTRNTVGLSGGCLLAPLFLVAVMLMLVIPWRWILGLCWAEASPVGLLIAGVGSREPELVPWAGRQLQVDLSGPSLCAEAVLRTGDSPPHRFAAEPSMLPFLFQQAQRGGATIVFWPVLRDRRIGSDGTALTPAPAPDRRSGPPAPRSPR